MDNNSDDNNNNGVPAPPTTQPGTEARCSSSSCSSICSICLESLWDGKTEFLAKMEPVVMQTCGHLFHSTCIQTSIDTRKATLLDEDDEEQSLCARCPLCQAEGPFCEDGCCDGECRDPYVKVFISSSSNETSTSTYDLPDHPLSHLTKTKLDAARFAKSLGIEIEKSSAKVEELVNEVSNVGWEHMRDSKMPDAKRMETFGKSVRELMDMLRGDHADSVLKEYIDRLATAASDITVVSNLLSSVQDLRQDLEEAQHHARERARIDAAVGIRAAELRTHQAEKSLQEEKIKFEREKKAFEDEKKALEDEKRALNEKMEQKDKDIEAERKRLQTERVYDRETQIELDLLVQERDAALSDSRELANAMKRLEKASAKDTKRQPTSTSTLPSGRDVLKFLISGGAIDKKRKRQSRSPSPSSSSSSDSSSSSQPSDAESEIEIEYSARPAKRRTLKERIEDDGLSSTRAKITRGDSLQDLFFEEGLTDDALTSTPGLLEMLDGTQ